MLYFTFFKNQFIIIIMPRRKVSSKTYKKNKNRTVLLIIVFGFLSVLLLLRFFTPNPSAKNSSSENVSVLEGLKEEVHVKTSTIEPDSAIWIESFDNLVILKGYSFKGEIMILDGENNKLKEIAQSYFLEKGFFENKINSFSNLDSNTAYRVQSQGFTRFGMKCLVAVFLQSIPSGYYFCGEEDNEKNKLQAEFMPVVYGENAKYPLQENEAAVLNVSKINDEFATGSNNRYLNGIYEPSGTTWIAAKVGGVWKLVFDSQDYPTCAAVDEYDVPRDFYKNCYDSSIDSFRFN